MMMSCGTGCGGHGTHSGPSWASRSPWCLLDGVAVASNDDRTGAAAWDSCPWPEKGGH